MKQQQKPQMSIFQQGEKYKILKVSGAKNTQMPEHITTREAVIIVQQGEALLSMNDTQIILEAGSVQIIPPMQLHSLLIKQDFGAMVIMPVESEIKFKPN